MLDFELSPTAAGAEKAPELRAKIHELYLCDEQDYVYQLLESFPETPEVEFTQKVAAVIERMRDHHSQSVLHQLLQEYDLSTDEGITLMCLAESLIRVPDIATANDLLIDKLSQRGWQHHLNKSESFWVNAASWGLAFSGRMLRPKHQHPADAITGLVNKLTLNITREAVQRAIRILGEQFVFAQTIEEAIEHAQPLAQTQQSCSFDMLGEAALTQHHADQYFEAYSHAIDVVAEGNRLKPNMPDSLSIKLSALHPRYEPSQRSYALNALVFRLLTLVKKAREKSVPITVDAEEQYRLDMSLEIFESVLSHQDICPWGQFGIAVQAYGKRALSTLYWLHALSEKLQTHIPVRLVKGAYWDSEIKWAQQLGLNDYPVFTQKASTDLNYLACARFLLNETQQRLRPMFATHNAWTALSIIEMQSPIKFEFQRLQGMGESLHNQLIEHHKIPCRIYSPVGRYKELLPYLVRRLIENGANSSFVFQVQDRQVPMHVLTVHPADLLSQTSILNPNVPLPSEIFVDYPNSRGFEVEHDPVYFRIMDRVLPFHEEFYEAAPTYMGHPFCDDESTDVHSSVDHEIMGKLYSTKAKHLDRVIEILKSERFIFNDLDTITERVEAIADVFEKNKHELIYLCMKEAGKTLKNAIDEVREAIDFCRYYSRQAQKNFADPTILDTVTGEENLLRYHPIGNVLCISPWNFPLAIFTGQVTAALACGNRVIAKPARQTSIIAQRAVELMYDAGISHDQLILLPGSGKDIALPLIQANVVDMVCFTGSTPAARQLQAWLMEYDQAFIPLLAETGGQNCMLADSTALIDQLVPDVIASAFDSAGQRCSALRVLFIQEDIKQDFYDALRGRMALLRVDSPFMRETDIGPIIDEDAFTSLQSHLQWLEQNGTLICKAQCQQDLDKGFYLAPCAYEIEHLNQLAQENFGPILHIIPFAHDDLDKILAEINGSGYGLTLGIHSRNQRWINYITDNVNVGNIYINRSMIAAKVGAQPFGGHGLSGTGPKAGGPNYVRAFVREYTVTTNTTAFGGNQDLLS